MRHSFIHSSNNEYIACWNMHFTLKCFHYQTRIFRSLVCSSAGWVSDCYSICLKLLFKISSRLSHTHVHRAAGENRLRYFQLLMNGSYTPWTLPVGGEEAREVSPRSLAEALLVMTNLTVFGSHWAYYFTRPALLFANLANIVSMCRNNACGHCYLWCLCICSALICIAAAGGRPDRR